MFVLVGRIFEFRLVKMQVTDDTIFVSDAQECRDPYDPKEIPLKRKSYSSIL